AVPVEAVGGDLVREAVGEVDVDVERRDGEPGGGEAVGEGGALQRADVRGGGDPGEGRLGREGDGGVGRKTRGAVGQRVAVGAIDALPGALRGAVGGDEHRAWADGGHRWPQRDEQCHGAARHRRGAARGRLTDDDSRRNHRVVGRVDGGDEMRGGDRGCGGRLQLTHHVRHGDEDRVVDVDGHDRGGAHVARHVGGNRLERVRTVRNRGGIPRGRRGRGRAGR